MVNSGLYLISYKDSGSLLSERKHTITQSRGLDRSTKIKQLVF